MFVHGAIFLLLCFLPGVISSASSDSSDSSDDRIITGFVYVDNYFDLWFNGEYITSDPIQITPHNGIELNCGRMEGNSHGGDVYAIKAYDYMDPPGDTGLESIPGRPVQLGDGGMRVIFSDGTVTNSNWRCFVVHSGPTNSSCISQPETCVVQVNDIPEDWFEADFDDSGPEWQYATQYTEEEVAWGLPPFFIQRHEINPEWIPWGNAEFIWTDDIFRHNIILCRYKSPTF